MKKILSIIVFAAFFTAIAKSQNNCTLPLAVVVPQQTDALSPVAQAKLESKLRQAVTKCGMDGESRFANFCIVANLTEGSKEVMSGVRPLVTISSELELYVGNNYTGEKFSSFVMTLRGAGNNVSKAYTAAFGMINASNPDIQKFLKDAKQKIYDFYETQVPNIILQAKGFSVRRNYEEALCLLSSVPTCCSRYDEVNRCMLEIYQQFVDYDCAVKVNKARNIWNASQDKIGAALAGAYLVSIDPASSCWDEALDLAETIRVRIGDEWEFSKELIRDAVMLGDARIEAARAIGVAYGQNQKAMTIKENWIVR